MRIHREPTAYSENRLGDRLSCAGAACLSARNYLLSFFLSGFSPPRFATRSAHPWCSFSAATPPPLLRPASTARTPPSSRSPRLLLYSSSPVLPLALRRPRMQQLREHASCSTGNESGPPLRRGREYRVIVGPETSKESIAKHRTFYRELIRLFGTVASVQSSTKI